MGDAEKAVFEYMKCQNRPYSAIDVFNNLHKKYGKTAVVKALELLAEKKKLLEKNYGKSKIYVVDQSQFPTVDDTKLSELDKQISSLAELVKQSQSKLSSSTSELKSLNSSLTTTNALELLKKLRVETSEIEKRLSGLKTNSKSVDANEKRKVTENRKLVITQWRKRKRMTVDLMNAVLEGYPKTKKQFLDEVGIETDEENKVVIPEI